MKYERMIQLAKPTIAVTMGDPLGIGPEIVIKSMAHMEIFDACNPILVGNRKTLERAAKVTNLVDIYERIKDSIVDVYTDENVTQEVAGKAAYDYIDKAVSLCLENNADAMATAPINKEHLKEANVPYIGHTEILAGLTNTDDPLTMFETDSLRIFFLSRHVSLLEACRLVKKERIHKYILKCDNALKRLGVDKGTMAVAALNPHCGEGGMFGKEEIEEIIPAVNAANQEGINVVGPIGADSVFHLAHMGRFNAVLSLYHDQGHIASKTLDFEGTISLTIGLPFLRTSVDHGTAMDIAWRGVASERSMVEAILVAAKYAPKYK